MTGSVRNPNLILVYVLKKNGFYNFNELYSLSLIWDPVGVKILKTLPLLQLQFFFNQTFSTYSLWQSSQNVLTGVRNFSHRAKFGTRGREDGGSLGLICTFSGTLANCETRPISQKLLPIERKSDQFRPLAYRESTFSTKLFLPIPCDNPHKTCLQEFEILAIEPNLGLEVGKTGVV